MADETERVLNLIEESERDWPDEPVLDRDGWGRLASLAQENDMASAAAGCLAAAGEWPEHTGWLTVGKDFEAQINDIGERHGFPSLPDHLNACMSLHLLVRTMPAYVETSDGVVRTEQGSTSWRDIRRKLSGWVSRAKKSKSDFLYLLALELHSNETSFVAAGLAGVRQRLTALLMRLETVVASGADQGIASKRDELAAILELMMQITGPGGGRHAHGKRRQECVVTAREFWKEQFLIDPTVVFVPDPTISPVSPFTKWFCDVMKCIDGWEVYTCRQVLRTRTRKK